MSRGGIALAVLAALTAAIFARLAWLHRTWLDTARGPSFDTRFGGYDLAAAQAYLTDLGAAGLGVYAGSAARLDTVFPLLLGLVLGAAVWRLTRRFNQWSRLVLLLVPAGYVVMDLAENALVQEMLAQGPAALDPHTVSLASRFTMTKFVLLAASAALIAVLALLRLGRNRRGAA